MSRIALVSALVALASASFVAPASPRTTTQLVPGVTYERAIQFTPRGPAVIRVVRGPRPTGLYRLRTVLSNETVVGRETVPSMQRRLARTATMVGVNGDLWRWADGKPSGIVLRDGVLVSPPHPDRSSAGIAFDGTLDVRRVRFVGTWRAAGAQRRLHELNDAPQADQAALFTSHWGRTTPRIPGSYAVTLTAFPPAVPGTDLEAVVGGVGANGPVPIQPGSAVLVGRGQAAAALRNEALPGTLLTLRLLLRPDWSTVVDAVGGGPVLVRDGRPVHGAGEAFTRDQLFPAHPRTAIGQLPDGRVLLVVVDGRQPGYSVGLTTFELALTMMRLGAVRAMQLDGGGSSTLAFDGRVLNRPSDGRERAISTAVMLEYHGLYLKPPEPVVSPNGDGVAEKQHLAVKVVRPSEVTVTLRAPDGAPVYTETAHRPPGTHAVPFPPLEPAGPVVPGSPPPPVVPTLPAEGRWTLTATALDEQGLASSASRSFDVNSTLGFVRVEPRRLDVRRPRRMVSTVSWTLARPARVTVTVETARGARVRTLTRALFPASAQSVAWDAANGNGRLVPTGPYTVRVSAANDIGRVELTAVIHVRRPPTRR